LSSSAIKAMTTNHLTPQQRRGGADLLGESTGWGYGMSVNVDAVPEQPVPGSIGWSGGFGTSWRSDPERELTSFLLTQRAFDSPRPAPLFDTFERAAGIR
jgi:CubicO group peptidase (beta-lactamase class C family)